MPKHIHADLMIQYAKDATETDKPWDRWEIYSEVNDRWEHLKCQAFFTENYQYRRKPDVIKINGFEVPAPLKVAPKIGTAYSYANPSLEDFHITYTWDNDDFDKRLLQKGLIHLTKEAAIAHAKALLSFTQIKE